MRWIKLITLWKSDLVHEIKSRESIEELLAGRLVAFFFILLFMCRLSVGKLYK